jgi:DNA polymerase-1
MLLQLVGEGVILYDTMRDRIYGPEETFAKLGVRPEQVADYLALTGDSSDNVPGVPSIGPKTASQLLLEHEDLDAIYAALDTVARKATRAKLAEHKDDAYLSKRLVTLRRDAPVTLDVEKLRYGGADEARLRELFSTLEFHKLLGQLAPRPTGPTSYTVASTEAELAAAVASAREAGRVAFYTLAEASSPLDAPIAGVALSWAPSSAVYVPLGHLYLGSPPQVSRERFASQVGPLLADPSVCRLALDSKREIALLARLGVEVGAIELDVTLASYLVDPERHGHSPEEVARTELHRELSSYDALTEKKGRAHKAMCDVHVEQARDFAAARADLAMSTRALLEPRLDGLGLRSLLTDVEIPLCRVLAKMERLGIEVDAEHLRRL